MPLVKAGALAHGVQPLDHPLLEVIGDVVPIGVLRYVGLQETIQPRRVRPASRHRRNCRFCGVLLCHVSQSTKRTNSFGYGFPVRSTTELRDVIIDAARAEFAQYGLAGSRIDRIAKSANASKERLYAHFGDKEALPGRRRHRPAVGAGSAADHAVRHRDGLPLSVDSEAAHLRRQSLRKEAGTCQFVTVTFICTASGQGVGQHEVNRRANNTSPRNHSLSDWKRASSCGSDDRWKNYRQTAQEVATPLSCVNGAIAPRCGTLPLMHLAMVCADKRHYVK